VLAQYDVKSIPTLVLLNGDTVLGKLIGVKPEVELRTWLANHIAIQESING
jgi:thioredoxin-like negative regulator of GroEL